MRMRACLSIAAAIVLAVCAQAPRPLSDEVIDALARDVSAELRCPVCQGLSIQDSPVELAQQMRGVVREQLAEGRSPEEVKAYFVERYGEWVLMRPPARGFNLAVYVLPGLALVGGVLLVVVLTRRWAGRGPGESTASGPPDDEPELAPWEPRPAAPSSRRQRRDTAHER